MRFRYTSASDVECLHRIHDTVLLEYILSSLTTLMWLLRFLAPTWADASFFSPRVELGYEVLDRTSVRINFSPVILGSVGTGLLA